jgi:ABC-2 type transport system permease protein
LFAKFLAGTATPAITLTALRLFVIGLAALRLGRPPSGEEVRRGFAVLLATIAPTSAGRPSTSIFKLRD